LPTRIEMPTPLAACLSSVASLAAVVTRQSVRSGAALASATTVWWRSRPNSASALPAAASMRAREASTAATISPAVDARSVTSLGAAGSRDSTLCVSWQAGTSESKTWKAEPGADAATPETAARRRPPAFLTHARDEAHA